MSVRIQGLKELRQQLTQLGALAGQRLLASAARAAMKPILEEARRLVPVGRGLLRDSLKLKATKPRSGSIVVSAGITFAAQVSGEIPATLDEDDSVVEGLSVQVSLKGAGWRWHFIEFGTRKTAAKPFLRPAFAARKGEALEIFKTILRKKVQKARLRQLIEEGYG